jgi:hypothetical protein
MMSQSAFSHLRKLSLIPLALFTFSNSALAYTLRACFDQPNYEALDEGGISSTVRIRVWLLEASNINYERTLSNLVRKYNYNRNDYYAECSTMSYINKEQDSEQSVFSCTNKHGQSSTSTTFTGNFVGSYFEIPIQNGLMVKLEPKESSTRIWCSLGQKDIFRTGRIYAPSGFTGKSYFSVTTFSVPPFKVKSKDPTLKDYKF